MAINYHQTSFMTSAAELKQLPEDSGIELAIAGRSNVGKSSCLNALTQQRHLAKTSKTPGRTQLLNVFLINDDENRRLIDLPGYGYAKVSRSIKERWQRTLGHYLERRQSLQALILVVDIRHPLKETDQHMLMWALNANLPVHVLLNKADKLKSGQQKQTLLRYHKTLTEISDQFSVQLFSALRKIGLDELKSYLDRYYDK